MNILLLQRVISCGSVVKALEIDSSRLFMKSSIFLPNGDKVDYYSSPVPMGDIPSIVNNSSSALCILSSTSSAIFLLSLGPSSRCHGPLLDADLCMGESHARRPGSSCRSRWSCWSWFSLCSWEPNHTR